MKNKFIFYSLFFILLISCSQKEPSINDVYLKQKELQKLQESQKTATLVPTKKTISLIAVGDNLIHIPIIESSLQADNTYNFSNIYSALKDEIQKADIACINQEAMLVSKSSGYSGYPNFGCPYAMGDALIEAGFDIVTCANNHTMDKGTKGIKESIEYYKQHPALHYIGIFETYEDLLKLNIIEVQGIKIALFNYTSSLNGHKLPKNKEYMITSLSNTTQIKKDLAKASFAADFTIVFIHDGIEYDNRPSYNQKKNANFLVENGADLIIGTHPHVVQPVELIKNPEGVDVPVFYSLGNFVSYQNQVPRMLGGLARVDITKDENNTYITNYSLEPIVTHIDVSKAKLSFCTYSLNMYTDQIAKKHRLYTKTENKMSVANLWQIFNDGINK